jgi:hypothetical protein
MPRFRSPRIESLHRTLGESALAWRTLETRSPTLRYSLAFAVTHLLSARRSEDAQSLAAMVKDRAGRLASAALGAVTLTCDEIVAVDPAKQTLVVRYADGNRADSVAAAVRHSYQEQHNVGAWRRIELRAPGGNPRVIEVPASIDAVLPGFQSLRDDLESFAKDLHRSLAADLAAAVGHSGDVPAELRGTYTAKGTVKACAKSAALMITSRHVEVSGCNTKSADGVFTVTKVESDGPIRTLTIEGQPPLVLKRAEDGRLTVTAAKGWPGQLRGTWAK